MDAGAQAEGERRVREMLIEPLLRRGLARPSSLRAAAFDEMQKELCQKLAYMSHVNLSALEEIAAANPGGKERDRFPIANAILDLAAQIQRPDDGASPLIRAVFAHALGREAIRDGWAPELLDDLRRNRRWPTPFLRARIVDSAREAIRQADDIRRRLERAGDVDQRERRWLEARETTVAKCRDIAAMVEGTVA